MAKAGIKKIAPRAGDGGQFVIRKTKVTREATTGKISIKPTRVFIETTKGAVVRARINAQIKKEAEVVLEAIGLDTSIAFRLMMQRIAKEKALPFDLHKPNKETLEAIREIKDGGGESAASFDEMLAKLNADD